MRVTIRGVTHPTVKAAADRHGVTPDAIYQALRRGTQDRVGLKAVRPTGRSCSRPVKLGPFLWESRRAAAKALGMKENTLSKRLVAGRLDPLIREAIRILQKPDAPH